MSARLLPVLLLVLTAGATAQPSRTLPDDEWCDRDEWGGGPNRETACEVRETVISARRLSVDASPNGGVKVTAWDRNDVLVRARVSASARRQSEADRLVAETTVRTDRGQISARTPRAENAGVSVSYEIFAPRRTDLALRTTNGGVSVNGLFGRIDVQAVNGGIDLADVAGAVRARTTNGGVAVALAGDAWDGEGLDVESTNGGISISLPPDYSATLSAQTQMGRISAPGVTVRNARRERGQRTGDQIEGTLGRGGAPLRAVTTNGGISIRRAR